MAADSANEDMSPLWKKVPILALLLVLACHWEFPVDPESATLELSPPAPALALGTSTQLQATEVLGDATTRDVTGSVQWSSSDAGVAVFSDPLTPGRVTTLGVGTVMLRATVPTSGRFAELVLVVTDAELVSIEVTPTHPALPLGLDQPFTAMGTFTDGTVQDLTEEVQWTSSVLGVATVSHDSGSRGLASSLSVGTTTITATHVDSGVSASTNFEVTPATLVSIDVTPTSLSLALGLTQSFTAMGTYTDATVQDITSAVTWSSSASSVASISNASGSKGRATSAAIGSTTITATHADSGISASTIFTVTNPTLVSIDITPSNPSVALGVAQAFTATGTYTDSSVQDLTTSVTWSSSANSVAAISNAVGTKGRASSLSVGSATITATQPGTGISATTNLTVGSATLVSIEITPSNPSVALGIAQQFTATGTYTDSSVQDLTTSVTWSSSSMGVATISNAAGTKGRATSVGAGSTTITATQPGSGVSAATTFTVSAATLVSIDITPSNPTVALGLAQLFTATGTYTDSTTQDLTTAVTWSSSATSIATISNAASSKGRATTLSAGTTTITAIHPASGVSASTVLTVTSATLVSLEISPTNSSKSLGLSQQFTATGTYTDSSTQDLTSSITWASSSIGVATISNAVGSKGLVSTVSAGNTTISATHPSSGISASTTFTVSAATLVSIDITPSNPSVALGLTQSFTAIGTYTDSSVQNLTTSVTWSSSSTTVATISNAAGTKGLATTASTGTTTITATYAGSGISASTSFSVSPATLVSIDVTPANPTVALGLAQSFTATGTYTDNSVQDLTSAVTWSSGATSVATISNADGSKGLATSVSSGNTTISATQPGTGVTGSTSFTVTSAALVSIAITPASSSKALGLSQQFIATGTYSDATTQDLTAAVTWASSSPSVASISNAAVTKGLASTSSTGSTTITATHPASGIFSSTSFTVSTATLVSMELVPSNATTALGIPQQFTATGTYTDGSTQNITSSVTWASANTSVATISNAAGSKGLATTVSTGFTNITATHPASGVFGSTIFTVTSADLTSISVTPASSSKALGLTQQFTATGTYTDATTQDITSSVTWSSSSTSIATISNAAGTRGLATSLAIGSTIITATHASSGVTANTTFSVTAAELVSLSVTPANSSKALGLTQQFTVTGTYTDATTQDITSSVTWSSSATSIATVSNAADTRGLATSLAIGSTTITATHASSGVTASTSFTVTAAEVVSLSVTPANSSKALGLSQQFTVTGTYTDGSTQDLTTSVTWYSSSTSIATISNTSGSKGLASTVAAGSTTITASHSGSGVGGSTTFTVTAVTLVSLSVTPVNPSITVGSTQSFTATGTYTNGATQDLTTSVTWSSSSSGVATISNTAGSNGLATSATTGSTTITATDTGSGLSASTSLTVSGSPPGPPTSLQTAATNGEILVSWDPPASTGGVPVTSYTVTLTPGGASATTTNVSAANRPAVGTITTRTTNPTGANGDWNTNNYGQHGHILAAYDTPSGDRAVLPADVTYTTDANRNQWATNTSDTSYLADPSRTTRTAGGWWTPTTMTQTLRFAEPANRTLRIYAHDFGANRVQTVAVTVGAATQTITLDAGTYTNGIWLDVPISVPAGGTATITTTAITSNGVISGIFLDAPTTNTCTIGGLTPGQPYTATITATNTAGTSPTATTTAGWSPAALSPALWLDANDPATITTSGSNVTAWADKSGNNRAVTQTTPGRQPALTTLGGRNALSLNGNRWLGNTTNSLTGTGTYSGSFNVFYAGARGTNGGVVLTERSSTLVAASQWVTLSGTYYLSSDGANIGSNHEFSAATFGRFTSAGGVVAHQHVPGARDNVWLNGTSEAVTTGTASNISGGTGFRIGRREATVGQNWDGSLGEVIASTAALTTTDRQILEGYLAHKWGTQATLPADHPYRNAPPGPTPTTTAAAPTITTTTPGNSQVTVNWTPPTTTGGAPISRYHVTAYTNPAGTTQTGNPQWTTTTGATTLTVTGLTNGTTYYFRVTPITTAGTGTPSAPSAAATPITTPAAPTGPLASRLSVSVLAGSGSAGSTDATGTSASFNRPLDGAFDSSGNLYVSDYTNNRIRRITPAGVVTTFASGLAGPYGLAFDTAGNLYVAEFNSHRITRITPGGAVSVFAGSGSPGSTDATGTAASFNEPVRLAFDSAGNLFVADRANHKIRRITPAGVVTTFAGSGSPGSANGTSTAASFTSPQGLAIDSSGDLFVSEIFGNRIRRITPAAVVTTFAGSGTAGAANGTGISATFDYPDGLLFDSAGNLLVADQNNNRIRKADPAALVSTFAGSTAGAATGPSTGAVLNGPRALARDSAGALHVVEDGGNRIARITPAGSGALAVNWTAPASNGGSAITDYLVEYRTSPSGTWTTFTDGVSTATSTTITGLTNGTAYDVRISAVNTTGTGTASTAVTATPGVAPDAPTSVLLTPGNTQLTATWTAPTNNGGAPVTDHTIEYRTSPAGTWTVFPDSVSTATSATITGLVNGTAYDVRIRAVNTYDISTPSVIATATPTGWTPAALGTNLSLWLDADEASSITLNGSTVSQWNDKSGNGRHATQGTASAQPAYTASGLNGRPVLTFDSTNDFLGTALTLPHPLSVYAVAQLGSAGGATARGILGSGNLSYALGFLNTSPSTASVEYLIVGGGGGGGRYIGGGGGGGGVRQGTGLAVAAQAYSVVVGAGGAGAGATAAAGAGTGSSGGNSSFNGITANGGGGGGGYNGAYTAPTTGGSGGGGSHGSSSAQTNGAAGTAGQGNAGGNGTWAPGYNAGGGGGAGAIGGNGGAAFGGAGGAGLSSSISGAATFYAGGGGGGAYTVSSPVGAGGAGGAGGGGAGQRGSGLVGGAGTTNSGGGGGGGSEPLSGFGGNGGSGVVIVRYRTDGSDGVSPASTGGTVTTSGIWTIHTFTANGTFTVVPASGPTNAYSLWNPNLNSGAYINNTTGLGPVVVGSTTASNDENTWNTYVNGSNAGQTISDTGTPNAPSPIQIGWTGNGTEYWSGPIAEVVVLSQTMTTADRQRVEGYLAHKWGLTANLPADHPYKNAAP
jgi:uncharacterized protein YjdB